MINEYSYDADGWFSALTTDKWTIGFLKYNERFSRHNEYERHLESDEAFILLAGEATLYTPDETVVMKPEILYNITKGQWHHIVVSKDAKVLVIENSSVSSENTENRSLTD